MYVKICISFRFIITYLIVILVIQEPWTKLSAELTTVVPLIAPIFLFQFAPLSGTSELGLISSGRYYDELISV